MVLYGFCEHHIHKRSAVRDRKASRFSDAAKVKEVEGGTNWQDWRVQHCQRVENASQGAANGSKRHSVVVAEVVLRISYIGLINGVRLAYLLLSRLEKVALVDHCLWDDMLTFTSPTHSNSKSYTFLDTTYTTLQTVCLYWVPNAIDLTGCYPPSVVVADSHYDVFRPISIQCQWPARSLYKT